MRYAAYTDCRTMAQALRPIYTAATEEAAKLPAQRDVMLYFEKAVALAAGSVPYRDFPFEYPPLALASMVVPYLAEDRGPDFETYRWLFLGWEGLLLALLVIVVARAGKALAAGVADEGPVAGLHKWDDGAMTHDPAWLHSLCLRHSRVDPDHRHQCRVLAVPPPAGWRHRPESRCGGISPCCTNRDAAGRAAGISDNCSPVSRVSMRLQNRMHCFS
jgi:hypothetical protein